LPTIDLKTVSSDLFLKIMNSLQTIASDSSEKKMKATK